MHQNNHRSILWYRKILRYRSIYVNPSRSIVRHRNKLRDQFHWIRIAFENSLCMRRFSLAHAQTILYKFERAGQNCSFAFQFPKSEHHPGKSKIDNGWQYYTTDFQRWWGEFCSERQPISRCCKNQLRRQQCHQWHHCDRIAWCGCELYYAGEIVPEIAST